MARLSDVHPIALATHAPLGLRRHPAHAASHKPPHCVAEAKDLTE